MEDAARARRHAEELYTMQTEPLLPGLTEKESADNDIYFVKDYRAAK